MKGRPTADYLQRPTTANALSAFADNYRINDWDPSRRFAPVDWRNYDETKQRYLKTKKRKKMVRNTVKDITATVANGKNSLN